MPDTLQRIEALPLPVVQGPDAAAAIQRVLVVARRHFGMEIAFVSEFTEGQRVFRALDAAPEAAEIAHVGDTNPLEESYCQRVVDGRLPGVIADAQVLPEVQALAITAAVPVGAHLAAPIRLSDGTVYGTFCCVSRTPNHTLRNRDAAVMCMLADVIAGFVEAQTMEDRDHAQRFARVEAILLHHGVRIVFQPVIELRTGSIAGYEALARFPGLSGHGPDAWFRDAHAVGLGLDLELAAIRAALGHRIPTGCYLALNASPATLCHPRTKRLLADAPGHRIVLEITEHEPIDDYSEVRTALEGYRSQGIRIAVDDAGAGYASFRHILGLEPELIKLDLTLTRGIGTDPALQEMARALTTFAHHTGASVIAEGIETDTDLSTLRDLDVGYGQGYLLGHPGPLPRYTTHIDISTRAPAPQPR